MTHQYSIQSLDSSSTADAAGMFSVYPYKTAQQKSQKLDRARLNAFYWSGLKKGLEAGTPHWVARNAEGKLIALAGLAEDAWHSKIYGMPMGKIQPWLNTYAPQLDQALLGQAGEALLEQVLSAARERSLRHLSVRIDGEDFANLHLFERFGFRTVDVSLKFSMAMKDLKDLEDKKDQTKAGINPDYQIELATSEDHEWIREIGSRTHPRTHFLNDPALARAGTQALFEQWLERCLNGLAYRVYTLKSASGEGTGFVTYLRAPGFAQAVGRSPIILDFALISPALRGRGLGPWFIHETLAREAENGFDYCELRTSAHNLPAVINYEKIGFRCCASDFVLHCPIT